MQKIFLLIFTMIIFLEGCKSPLEKFVFTPLTTQELDKIVKEDNSFLNTYSIIEEKSNKFFTSADSLRFKDLTYLRLHTYIKEIENKKTNSIISSNSREDWLNKYNRYNNRVDSLITYWTTFIESNSPDSLCTVTNTGYNSEKVRVQNKIVNNIRLKFKIKALNSGIDSLVATYLILDSTNIYSQFPLEYKRRIRDSVVHSVILNPDKSDTTDYNALLNNPNTVVKANLISVFSGGKCYNSDTLRNLVPVNVLTLIESSNTTETIFDETIYRDLIIKEFIDSSFPSQEAYIKNSLENYHKNLDTLAYNYIHYNRL